MEYDLNFVLMEENLNFFENGRRPHNRILQPNRVKSIFFKWKTTSKTINATKNN